MPEPICQPPAGLNAIGLIDSGANRLHEREYKVGVEDGQPDQKIKI